MEIGAVQKVVYCIKICVCGLVRFQHGGKDVDFAKFLSGQPHI